MDILICSCSHRIAWPTSKLITIEFFLILFHYIYISIGMADRCYPLQRVGIVLWMDRRVIVIYLLRQYQAHNSHM